MVINTEYQVSEAVRVQPSHAPEEDMFVQQSLLIQCWVSVRDVYQPDCCLHHLHPICYCEAAGRRPPDLWGHRSGHAGQASSLQHIINCITLQLLSFWETVWIWLWGWSMWENWHKEKHVGSFQSSNSVTNRDIKATTTHQRLMLKLAVETIFRR